MRFGLHRWASRRSTGCGQAATQRRLRICRDDKGAGVPHHRRERSRSQTLDESNLIFEEEYVRIATIVDFRVSRLALNGVVQIDAI